MKINKINFREKKVSFFYNFYLRILSDNEIDQNLLKNTLLNFKIIEVEEIENMLENLKFIEDEIMKSLST